MNNIIGDVFELLKYKNKNIFNNHMNHPPPTPLSRDMKKRINRFKENNEENIFYLSSNGNGNYNYILIKMNNNIYEVLISGMDDNEKEIEYIKEYND